MVSWIDSTSSTLKGGSQSEWDAVHVNICTKQHVSTSAKGCWVFKQKKIVLNLL